jgi:hypothetical protein
MLVQQLAALLNVLSSGTVTVPGPNRGADAVTLVGGRAVAANSIALNSQQGQARNGASWRVVVG